MAGQLDEQAVKNILNFNEARDSEVNVAPAGPYTNHLHFTTDRYHTSNQFLQDRYSSWFQTNCSNWRLTENNRDSITHTNTFNGLCPGLRRWASTRKVKPTWILLEQETVSGSGISWATCKSAHRSRQITMPAPHPPLKFFTGQMPFLLPNQQRQSTEGAQRQHKVQNNFCSYKINILTLRSRETISMWPLATASCKAEPSRVRLLMSQPASSNKLQSQTPTNAPTLSL